MKARQVDLAIFYADGSIVEAPAGDEVEVTFTFRVSRTYLEAPSHGVQAVVVRDPYVCRQVLRGQDYYYALPGGLVHAADNLTPWLEQNLPGLVKHGVCLDTDDYADVMRRVKEYRTIPRDGCARKPRPDDDV